VYVAFMGTAAAIGLFRTAAFARYLTPTFMGYYAVATTVAGYGMLLQLGLLSGLARELAVALGGGRRTYASGLVGETTVALMLLYAAGLSVYFLILALIPIEDPTLKAAMRYGGLLAPSSALLAVVMLRLRSEQRPMAFSLLQLVTSVGTLILGVTAALFFSYGEVVLAAVGINVVAFFVGSRFLLPQVNYAHLRIAELKYLSRIGMPAMFAGVLLTFQNTMDRLFLLQRGGAEDLGLYQVGALPLTAGLVISGIVSQYVQPALLFKFGEGKSIGWVVTRTFAVSLTVLVLMLLSWPVVVPTLGYVVGRWLPDYQASVPLFSVFYVGSAFTAANLTGVITHALNRQRLVLYASIVTTTLGLVAYSFIGRRDDGLVPYAYANAGLQVINYFLTAGLAYHAATVAGGGVSAGS